MNIKSKLQRNKLKKLALLFAVVFSVSALAACSTAAPSESAPTPTTSESTQSETTTVKSTTTLTEKTTTEASTTIETQRTDVLDPKKTNLRGELIASGKKAARILAVMLDNHPDARYQAGLKDADIIFEMPVEGSFTRYLALFQSSFPEVVGSVRSARDQFIDRMLEFDAVFLHFGGSTPSLSRIATEGYETIDGIAIASQYWRNGSTGKVAPHNAYTNLTKIPDYIEKMGWHTEAEFDNYYFHKTAKKPGGKNATDVTININSSNQTSYKYLPKKNAYERYKNGDKDLDENTKTPIEVSNIIIQNANYYVYAESWQKIEQITEGSGYYISMGEIVPITWKKTDEKSLTRYFTADGAELALNPGQTWIQIVNLGVEPIVK